MHAGLHVAHGGRGHEQTLLAGETLHVVERKAQQEQSLLDENLRDPLSGNAVLSGVPVRLEPENA